MGEQIRIALKRLVCLEETGEPTASDEPYVIVFAVDVRRPDGEPQDDLPQFVGDPLACLVPSTRTVLYGPWSNTDRGEIKQAGDFSFTDGNMLSLPAEVGPATPVWSRAVDDPDDVLLIVGVMENDEANTGDVRTVVHTLMTASLASYWSDYCRRRMSRNDMAGQLVTDMTDLLSGVAVQGVGVEVIFPGFGFLPQQDDLIEVRELRVTQRDLDRARVEDEADIPVDIASETGLLRLTHEGDAARYRLFFEILCGEFDDDATAAAALTEAESRTFIPRPAILSRRLGYLDVLGRGRDRRIYLSSWNGQRWSSWSAIGVGTFKSAPAFGELQTLRGRIPIVIGRGDDRRLYESKYRNGRWSPWRVIDNAATFMSCPSLVGRRAPTLFATGDDRRIYVSSRANGRWGAWRPIGEGVFLSAPAAVQRKGGRLDVFGVGDDRHVYHSTRNGSDWTAWERIGRGTFRSAPAAASWAADRLDLFAVGDDRRMYHCTWTPHGWSGWTADMDDAATFSSAPAAISTQPNRLDVVAYGDDLEPYHNAWLGDRWSGWLKDTPEGVFA